MIFVGNLQLSVGKLQLPVPPTFLALDAAVWITLYVLNARNSSAAGASPHADETNNSRPHNPWLGWGAENPLSLYSWAPASCIHGFACNLHYLFAALRMKRCRHL